MLLINKDTKIYGSFSMEPGNNGNIFFNDKFQQNNINAIYKSFYSNNIKNAVEAAKQLGFSGFAVSAPFKEEVLEFVEGIETPVNIIGAANTIINTNGCLVAHNTDWLGVYKFFNHNFYKNKLITILGNGGFSKATQYAFNQLGIKYNILTRKKWYKIPNIPEIMFNCTPIDVKEEFPNIFLIDGRPFTEEGKVIARLQAEEQFKLYMKYAT